ncbi:MAG TPA: energy transducer TonB [Steroidobacteraceae bacterium]|nr:energy transducer TonB [Steroidobacteraceae bacterium]
MGVYTHSEGNWLSRRGTFLVILVAFHVLLFWALKSGFAIKLVKSITEPLKVDIPVVKIQPPPPPPPPPVRIEMPPVQVPPVLVDIPNPPPPPPDVIIAKTTTEAVPPGPPVPPTPSPPAHGPVVTRPVVISKPDIEDFYPRESKSAGEEGVVKIKLCWDVKGKVLESSLAETSSHPRLDEAAVRMGKQFRLKPGTEDGRPVAACAPQPVRFSLKEDR